MTRALVAGAVAAMVAMAATPARAEDYTVGEVRAIARELATKMNVPLDKQGDLWTRLDRALDDPAFFSGRPQVNGVIVYQRGGGGFIVKVQKARALGRFKAHPKLAMLQFEQVSYGATVGGGTEYGVALVLGLQDVMFLGGEYSGGTRGGTMGKASMSVTEVTHKATVGTPAYHKLYLIGTGAGAGADAAGASIKLQLLNWMD